VNLERHDGHAAPLVFVAHADPMFVAVCAPHEQPGPWGEPQPYRPPTPAEREAAAIVHAARARAELAEPEDAADQQSDGGLLVGSDWVTDARSQLAAGTLALLQERFRVVRFDVEVWSPAEPRRPALAAYAKPEELWFTVDDDERAVVATRSPDAVAFLTGLKLTRSIAPYVTVALRGDDLNAVLYCDADDDRFYVAEPSGVVVAAALEFARFAGFEEAVADDGIWVMSGLHDHFAKLKSWALRPGNGLPF
jgi:hypothetical protein